MHSNAYGWSVAKQNMRFCACSNTLNVPLDHLAMKILLYSDRFTYTTAAFTPWTCMRQRTYVNVNIPPLRNVSSWTVGRGVEDEGWKAEEWPRVTPTANASRRTGVT